MKAKSNRKYGMLAVIILAALCIVFYKNIEYHYEMQGETAAILESHYAGASGYHVTDISQTANAKSFAVTTDDPQFYLSREDEQCIGNQNIGGVELVFSETMQAQDAALPIQLFYRAAGEGYTEKHSVKASLEKGKNRVMLPIPLGEYAALRIDIDGDFQLSEVHICTKQMTATPYISARTIRNCLWYFPAVIIGFCLIFWAHSVRMRETALTGRSYVAHVFGSAKGTKDRAVHFDYLRILAAVFVILAHACSPMVTLADAGWKRFILVCGLSLGLCCNLIYVMLSGALLLRSQSAKEERVGIFYLRRASKVVIPLIAYYLLLLSLNNEVGFLPPRHIGTALKRIVSGAPDVGPHLWLIYTIVALYLVTPFFRVMVQHLSDKMLFSLAAVILAMNILTMYLPLLGMTWGASTFLAGWEGVFLLGYILARCDEKNESSIRNRVIYFAAIVSYAIMAAVVFLDSAQMNYVYNNAPTMVITSCGIFAYFLKNKDWFANKSNFAVRLFSKYSYSIILIHWYVLFVVVQDRLHITALRFGCIGGIGATVILTFLIGLVMAIVFDNTVVIVCNVVFEKLTITLRSKRS